jgi:hypothetical protein
MLYAAMYAIHVPALQGCAYSNRAVRSIIRSAQPCACGKVDTGASAPLMLPPVSDGHRVCGTFRHLVA